MKKSIFSPIMICISEDFLDQLLTTEKGNTVALLLAIALKTYREEPMTGASFNHLPGLTSSHCYTHLRKLVDAGLVTRQQEKEKGRYKGISYTLATPAISFAQENQPFSAAK
jgi:predicted transcriptional regulator